VYSNVYIVIIIVIIIIIIKYCVSATHIPAQTHTTYTLSKYKKPSEVIFLISTYVIRSYIYACVYMWFVIFEVMTHASIEMCILLLLLLLLLMLMHVAFIS